MRVFHLFAPVFSLFLFLAGGCFHEGPWDNCPDFEVRRLTFQKEKKLHPNKGRISSYYLLRWNILGPILPAGRFPETPDLEEEENLCGFVNAPYPAMWRVKHFPLEPEKNPLFQKESDFTSVYKDVKKESIFYFCSTLENPEGEKEACAHIASSGRIIMYLNGAKVYTSSEKASLKEEETAEIRLLPGKNRLVLKYRDGKEGNRKRSLTFRITLPKEKKSALIR